MDEVEGGVLRCHLGAVRRQNLETSLTSVAGQPPLLGRRDLVDWQS